MALFHVEVIVNIIVEAKDSKDAIKIAESQSMEDFSLEEFTTGNVTRINTLAEFNTLKVPGWTDDNYPYGGNGNYPINKILK